jgi:hypothetical protein
MQLLECGMQVLDIDRVLGMRRRGGHRVVGESRQSRSGGVSDDLRAVQAKRPAPRDGIYGNQLTDGRTVELRERMLAVGDGLEPDLLRVVVFLRKQRTASHECAIDASDERVEEVLELEGRERWRAMEAPALTFEGVGTIEREDVNVHVSCRSLIQIAA